MHEAPDPLVERYGLTPERCAEIRLATEALEAVVAELADALPFEAEPWGFGQALWQLARAHAAG
jgi:hypothetical protein